MANRTAPARWVRRTTSALLIGALMFTLTTLGAPARADTTPTGSATTSALRPVMLVMDYSGSMLTKDADSSGTTRLKAAQDAVKGLLDRVPDEGELGLTVYGTTNAKSCGDITTVQPLRAIDKPALRREIDQLHAVGQTPIGASLLKAAESFKDREGPKSIVLVSDGQETCARPAACDAARTLAQRGIDLTVHTIGFRVSGQAQTELRCIADATGGTYTAARDANQLAEKLATRTFRAFQGYEVSGTPVSGSAEYQDAPGITPGQYRDQLENAGTDGAAPKDGTVKYYRLGDAQPGQRLHLAVLQAGRHPVPKAESNRQLGVEVELEADDGTSCGPSDRDSDLALSTEPVVAYTHTSDSFSGPDATCSRNGSPAIYAKVTRTGARFTGTPLPIELAYWAEPAANATASAAPRDPSDTPKPAAITVRGDAQPVLGGAGFNASPILEGGKVYRDSVQRDEMRFYRVHVAQGQRLSYRLASVENDDTQVLTMGTDLYSPVRQKVYQNSTGGGSLSFDSSGDHIDLSMREVVDVTNRTLVYGADQYLAGDYYIAVVGNSISRSNGTDPEFTYDLTVQVDGNARPGTDVALSDGKTGDSTSADAGSTPNPTDPASAGAATDDASSATGTSDAASAPPASGSDTTPSADAQGTRLSQQTGVGIVIPWLVGALGLVVIVAGAVWFVATRSQRHGPNGRA